MNNTITNLKSKYREMKDKIPVNAGKIVERILFFTLVILTFIFIPVVFTTLSTLAGSGAIALTAYNAVSYTTWAILLIAFIAWVFFKEFKNK